MILIDASAWIEFVPDTGSPTCDAVERLLTEDIAICDAVRMEILAGARDNTHLENSGATHPSDLAGTTTGYYETAAALYRSCR